MVHFPASYLSLGCEIEGTKTCEAVCFLRSQEDSKALPLRIDNVTWQQQHGWAAFIETLGNLAGVFFWLK